MELYIIRHAETDFNKAGIVQGRGVNMPINDTGRLQAQLFYDTYKDIAFDALFASSLIRTQQTVELFKQKIAHYDTDSALDEISWGNYEGLPPSHQFNIQYRQIVDQWTQGNHSARVDGGESIEEVFARQQTFINKLVAQPYNRVLICTHGRALRILLAGLLNRDLSSVEQYAHHNTGLYVIQYAEDTFTMIRPNDLSHLKPLLNHA